MRKQAKVIFEVLDAPPLVLHEVVATGEYRGEPCEMIRTTNGEAMFIKWRGKAYKINAVDLIMGVLEEARKPPLPAPN